MYLVSCHRNSIYRKLHKVPLVSVLALWSVVGGCSEKNPPDVAGYIETPDWIDGSHRRLSSEEIFQIFNKHTLSSNGQIFSYSIVRTGEGVILYTRYGGRAGRLTKTMEIIGDGICNLDDDPSNKKQCFLLLVKKGKQQVTMANLNNRNLVALHKTVIKDSVDALD